MTKFLPTIICSSVVRSSKQGESHGGIYLIDLETEKVNQLVNWNDTSISWEGRGLDRGLRGIAFYYQYIICAASNEILFFNQKIEIVKSFKNPYLKHCHEIFVEKDLLYLTSTGFDAILIFDLKSEQFTKGYQYKKKQFLDGTPLSKFRKLSTIRSLNRIATGEHFQPFNPNIPNGPVQINTHHINNVFVENENIYFSGTKMKNVMKISQNNEVDSVCSIPLGTHNVCFYKDHLIYNDTMSDRVVIKNLTTESQISSEIIRYEESSLEYASISKDYARQSFGRGLCFYKNYVIAGSSPSTICVYELTTGKRLKHINISKDIRNAIHGLEVIL